MEMENWTLRSGKVFLIAAEFLHQGQSFSILDQFNIELTIDINNFYLFNLVNTCICISYKGKRLKISSREWIEILTED